MKKCLPGLRRSFADHSNIGKNSAGEIVVRKEIEEVGRVLPTLADIEGKENLLVFDRKTKAGCHPAINKFP